MEYRNLGKTGMCASVIGVGAEHLDGKPYPIIEETIHTALELGINIFDVFMPGEKIRRHIGKTFGKKRKDVIIQGHICSVEICQQYGVSRELQTCKDYFEKLLVHLGTDYIDVGMLFFVDTNDDLQQIHANGIIDYALQLKQHGIIRAIGASSHNPVIARKLLDTGIVDVLMFSINPAFDMTPAGTNVLDTVEELAQQKYKTIDPARANLYTCCEQRGIAVTAMKTLGGGRLLSSEHTPFIKPMTVAQCIHYVLTRPAVASAMVGCQTVAHIEEAVKYLTATKEQRDYMDVISQYRDELTGKCVYCNHCQPCSANIDIATVNKYLDIAVIDKNNIPASIRQHYKSLPASGVDCISCGNCEKKCPFSVPVIENMRYAAKLLS